MPGKMARSPDRTSFGTAGNARSTAQPAHGYRGAPPSGIVHAVPGFIWRMSVVYCSFFVTKFWMERVKFKSSSQGLWSP